MKTVIASKPFAGYYSQQVKVQQSPQGRHKGKFRIYGCGYAGRVYYASAERAKAIVEANALFAGWE